MVNNSNTIYEIRFDFDLNGKTIRLKKDSELKYAGGSLSNGNVRFLGNGVISGDIKLTNGEFVGYYSIEGVTPNLVSPTKFNNQELIKVAESYLTRKDLFKYGGDYTCFAEEC